MNNRKPPTCLSVRCPLRATGRHANSLEPVCPVKAAKRRGACGATSCSRNSYSRRGRGGSCEEPGCCIIDFTPPLHPPLVLFFFSSAKEAECLMRWWGRVVCPLTWHSSPPSPLRLICNCWTAKSASSEDSSGSSSSVHSWISICHLMNEVQQSETRFSTIYVKPTMCFIVHLNTT